MLCVVSNMSARTWCLLWNEMITSSYKSHIRVWLHDWEKKKVAFTIYSYNHYWWLLMRNLIVLVFCESANFLLGQKYYEYMWFCQISVLERDFWISKHSLYIATWPKILWHYFEGGCVSLTIKWSGRGGNRFGFNLDFVNWLLSIQVHTNIWPVIKKNKKH